ncbi:MAG: AI-2E family transporter [Bacteroidaceae bacterium]|nr:AI-2E family transporter [Bacteroidaceae bacterium]
MKQNEISLGRFLRIVLLVVGMVVAYFVLKSLSGVLLPFAIAWLFAYLLNPLVNFLQNRLRFKYRALSIIGALLFLGLVLYGIVMLVLPSMFSELYALKDITISFLGRNINDGSIPEPILNLFKELSAQYGFAEMLEGSANMGLMSVITDRLKMMLLGTLDVFGQVLTVSLIMLYMFFILLDFERVSRAWKPYVPKKWRRVVLKLWSDLVYGMNQYFRGQALVALCVGVLFSIGFLIVDFPAAIAFGLFVGLLNLVPYLQVVSLLPMALLAMLKAANCDSSFWPVMLSGGAVMLVVQLIQDMFLVPKIMGKRMNLHPAIILLSLSIWGHLLGVLGMIVALPLTTLLLAYLKRYNEIAETSDSSEEYILREAIDSTRISKKSDEGVEKEPPSETPEE